MKNDWKNCLISYKSSLRDAIDLIDKNLYSKFGVVTDDSGRLLGTITDGDIRRGILKGMTGQASVSEIMRSSPITVSQDDSRAQILRVLQEHQIHQVPIVDNQNIVVGVELIEHLTGADRIENKVVLMAGGLGTRLRPHTENCPKPLLKVGEKPILETILESYINHGFYNFYVSVNYLSEMVEDYFGDGSRWNVNIQYIREDDPRGTAGALKLLPEKPEEPIFVMNGDLLTKVDFKQLLNFHHDCKAMATMSIREYDFQIPYGVVRVDEHNIAEIEEKPVEKFFVNAGIYVLSPEALELIPSDVRFDMPQLFNKLIAEKQNAVAFPIREYWIDIGHANDYERAIVDYAKQFQ